MERGVGGAQRYDEDPVRYPVEPLPKIGRRSEGASRVGGYVPSVLPPPAMRVLGLFLALTFATSSSAQVRQGLVELGGSASLISIEGTTVLSLAPTVGYFLTDAVEATVGLSYAKVEGVDGSGSLTLGGAYHFARPRATTVPFVEALVGTSFTDGGDVVFGGGGGAKFFFLPGGALTARLQILTDGDVTQVGALGGVSIFIGR